MNIHMYMYIDTYIYICIYIHTISYLIEYVAYQYILCLCGCVAYSSEPPNIDRHEQHRSCSSDLDQPGGGLWGTPSGHENGEFVDNLANY